jgi:hypothetical protein
METFSEAWEFYCPDPEVAELVAAPAGKAIQGATDHRKLVFSFAGNRHMEQGLFDGIRLGGVSLENWLRWGQGATEDLSRLFEAKLASLHRENRTTWMIESVGAAWRQLPLRQAQVMLLLVTHVPPPREPRPGRRPSPRHEIGRRLGLSPTTVYRHWIGAKLFLLNELVGEALCACGCGRKVKVAYVNNKRYGHCAGQPNRFLTGHNGIVTKRRLALKRALTSIGQVDPADMKEFLDEVLRRYGG